MKVILGMVASLLLVGACATKRPVPETGNVPARAQPTPLKSEEARELEQAIAPKVFPPIPPADAAAAWVAPGYRVEVAVRDLEYPTSVEVDDAGNLYVAEAGFAYGDPAGSARILRVSRDGQMAIIGENLRGPVTDLLWHDGRLYISHQATVSVQANGERKDIITDLPTHGDHPNGQLAIGADNKIYVGVGTATNSGVVGLDNAAPFLWLLFWPDVHDIPPYDVEVDDDVVFTTPDPLTVLANTGEMTSFLRTAKHLVAPGEPLLVKTGPFQPFGKRAERIKGRVKSNGTILRANLDGSALEVFAWGMRSPFGLTFGPDGALYSSDNGYDERGSRPIANAPDCIWRVRRGGFYGFPDYACGIPVTHKAFRSKRGPEPEMILERHPPVERPFMTRPPHAATAKLDFSPGQTFGHAGQMFLAELGDATPVGAPTGTKHAGYQVVRIDMERKTTERFFGLRPDRIGPKGYEHAVTQGPRRPVDVRFSPNGDALYIADFGGLVAFPAGSGPLAHPYPGSGVVWRVTRDGVNPAGPPPDRSPLPPRAQ